MMKGKERIRDLLNLLIIACGIILFGFLGGFVSGILNLGETAGIILRTAGLLLLISLGMKLVSQYSMNSLTQEMKEEGIRESEQEDEKQLLFKPTTGSILIFLFLILIGIVLFLEGIDMTILKKSNENVFGIFIGSFFMIGLSLFLWYLQPVFIFAAQLCQLATHKSVLSDV